MGVFLLVVALDGIRGELELPQLVVQQNAGAGAPLAVAEPDLGTGQVLEALDVFGVAGQDHEPLGPVHQIDELQGQLRQQAFDRGHIIGIGLGVEEVAAAEMGPAVLQGQQTAGAPHVGRGQAQVRDDGGAAGWPARPGCCRGCR